MKQIKKMLALVIAMVMIVGTMNLAAFAATGGRTAETEVTISGLDEGDTVKLYQVLDWDDANSTGWIYKSPFTSASGLVGTDNNGKQTFTIDTGVVATLSGQIGSTTPAKSGTAGSDGSYKATDLDAGLYIAIVTAKKSGVVYSPIIVSADFDEGGNSIDASASNATIPNSVSGQEAVAKKKTIPLDKTAQDGTTHDTNTENTVAVGDEITFTVTTTIPPFVGYVKPAFSLTDSMSKGLTYTTGSVEVTTPEGLTKGTQYKVTGESATGYTLSFDEEYLKNIAAPTDVVITYTATVTTNAVKSVNPETNTVTLEYSNNPNDANSKSRLRDRTNHYTFNIDGDLLGHDNYSATEVVKIGVSADGTEITKTTVLSNENAVGALEGAHFALYAVDSFDGIEDFTTEGKTAYSNKDAAGATVSYADITSGADGRISIKGIDAGKYVLVETKAPAGYIKRSTPITIEIIPEIETDVTYEEDADGVTVEVKTNELKSYKVKIDGVETASYSITNSADNTEASSSIGDSVVGRDDESGKIKNTQGVELPSTGGIGTTLFYVIGAILVVGAGILLVTRRRMNVD